MHRSASTNRVWDDYLKYHPSSSSPPPSSKASPALRSLSLEANELPVFEPLSEMSKKEKSRSGLAENAVHVIPLLLLLCALLLWFFSNPAIEVPMKGDSNIAARIEGMMLEGEVDGDNTETGVLAGIDLGDLDPGKQYGDHKASTNSQNKS